MVAIVSTEQLLKQSTTVDAREVHAEKMPQPWVWGGEVQLDWMKDD